MSDEKSRQDRFRGLMLGTAVGDALGLPAEGLSPRRAARMFKGVWRHRFLPFMGRGMISDDTEHTILTAQSLLAHPDDADRFSRRLARGMKWWLAALPAGVGLATLRAGMRLWIGMGPARSGVFSAGNGPAMRSAPIGAFFAADPRRRTAYVRAATRMTHTDPRAFTGALAVASLAAWAMVSRANDPPEPDAFFSLLAGCADDTDREWKGIIQKMGSAFQRELPTTEFAAEMGLAAGVTGYVYHTVPVAAYAWRRHFGDFSASLKAVLNCGGDADTTGAIVGAMAGAVSGETGISGEWIDGIWEWPRSPALMRRIADRLAMTRQSEKPPKPVGYFLPGVLPRNIIFMLAVLAHGLRRLLPPY